jgi:hypothetical protein
MLFSRGNGRNFFASVIFCDHIQHRLNVESIANTRFSSFSASYVSRPFSPPSACMLKQYTNFFAWSGSCFESIFSKVRLFVECLYSNFVVSSQSRFVPIFRILTVEVERLYTKSLSCRESCFEPLFSRIYSVSSSHVPSS